MPTTLAEKEQRLSIDNFSLASILSSSDEREAAISLLDYILQAGMRYMSDISLGTYQCDYAGIHGASEYSLGWKQRHEAYVAEVKKKVDGFKEWDQEKYEKLLNVLKSADTIHYVGLTFPDEDGEAVKNYEQTTMPPVSSMPIIASREENWIQKFNEKYGK